MSKKRVFAQLGGVYLFPASKRRRICNAEHSNVKEEEKETECARMDMDNESIASVVESIDSLESDTDCMDQESESEQECTDLLYKLQYNPQLIIPSHHFTQSICILGGNYKLLNNDLLQLITKDLLQIINDYNFKLHAIHRMDYSVNTNESKLKLVNSMVTQQLLKNKHFNKVALQHNHHATSTYEECDICLVFPDHNLHILCQLITFINSSKNADNMPHRLNGMEPYTKRLLLINIGGFFNGLRLQIMNFSANDLPQPVNIVFVDEFDAAITQ
eukprot:441125_1